MTGPPAPAHSFTINRTVAAPARTVFEAWTNPAVIRRWWHPAPHWHTRLAESDPRVGGHLRLLMHNPDDGSDSGARGHYTVIDPYVRLAFTWTWDGAARTSLVELSFSERDGHTDVVLTHSGLENSESAARHEQGWGGALTNLEQEMLSPPAPSTEVIPRLGKGTKSPDHVQMPAADWDMVTAELRNGSTVLWLGTVDPHGRPHIRPVLAAWTGSAFVVASNRHAIKGRNLRANPQCTIACDIGSLHVVVECQARRISDHAQLLSASKAMQNVFGWPTEVVGDQLDADYAAPTSGGPPFDIYEMQPIKAFAFPTHDEFEPTVKSKRVVYRDRVRSLRDPLVTVRR